jgi:hypothetical protein
MGFYGGRLFSLFIWLGGCVGRFICMTDGLPGLIVWGLFDDFLFLAEDWHV